MSQQKNQIYVYKLSIILALEIMLSFSVLGYIEITPVSVSFVPSMVLIAALILGPFESTIAGIVFGLTSMWKATDISIVYGDLIFSPFLSGKPVESLILSIGTRMLFGFVAGYLLLWAKKRKKFQYAAIFCMSIVSMYLHSFFVYGTMDVFFPKTGVNVWHSLFGMGDHFRILDKPLSAIIILLIYAAANSNKVKEFEKSIEEIGELRHGIRKPFWQTGYFLMMILLCTGLVMHLYGRIEAILGDAVTPDIQERLFQIILQFQAALLAFSVVFGIVLMLSLKFSLSMEIKAKKDLMTGVYNKSTAVDLVSHSIKKHGNQLEGSFFLMMDIDNFKNINDTHGHYFGDQVLSSVADILNESFRNDSIIGRMGGDEFCVFVKNVEEKSQIYEIVNQVIQKINNIALPCGETGCITCSIGIAKYKSGMDFSKLYQIADQVLYHVKEEGKNGFSFEYSDICDEGNPQVNSF